MIDWQLYSAFLGVVFLLAITPGTDNLYILTRTLSDGKEAGFLAALGISFGLVFHITAATLGLAQLFQNAPGAYAAIRWLGILYLLYLAFQVFRAKNKVLSTSDQVENLPKYKIIKQAMTLCLFNPKLLIFFVAFLPQFSNPTIGPINTQLFVLGLSFAIESLLVFLGMVIFVAPLGHFLRTRPQFWKWQGRITGFVFVTMALFLAVFG